MANDGTKQITVKVTKKGSSQLHLSEGDKETGCKYFPFSREIIWQFTSHRGVVTVDNRDRAEVTMDNRERDRRDNFIIQPLKSFDYSIV